MSDAERPRPLGAAPSAEGEAAPPRPPRWVGRLSAGHVVMLTAALVAVLLNYSVLRVRDDTVRVAVATEQLRAGMPVSGSSLEFVDVRVDDHLVATLLPSDRLADVEGWVATGPVGAGELLRASDLQPPSAPAAQRAMSVPVDPGHAVAGALEPGDRVDVIEVRGATAAYLLTDAEVLAVTDVDGGIQGLSSFSVTLAVDDEAALRLARAAHEGVLDIVRSTGAAAADAPDHRADDAPDPEAADVPGAEAADVPGAEAADVPGAEAADVPGAESAPPDAGAAQ